MIWPSEDLPVDQFISMLIFLSNVEVLTGKVDDLGILIPLSQSSYTTNISMAGRPHHDHRIDWEIHLTNDH